MKLPPDFASLPRNKRVDIVLGAPARYPTWMIELLADEAELDRRMREQSGG